MHVIFMGPQGAGKGTQATRIAEQLELVHVSTGELFRNAIKAKTPLGVMAKEILDRGDLVPDDITLGIVEKRLKKSPKCGRRAVIRVERCSTVFRELLPRPRDSTICSNGGASGW